jgi:ubiquinone/menaquinone biosynthesis C-methylase UbiE
VSITKFIRDVESRFGAIPGPAAEFYDVIARKILAKPERKIADDIVEKTKSGTILDLGAGPGYLSIEVAKSAPSLQVYGIDLSRKMVEIARRHAKGVENVQFEFGNAAELPFEDDSIDFIISTASLHHWRRPAKVFNECYRVLKNCGKAWIYDLCYDVLEKGDKVKKQYGFWIYQFLAILRIIKFHSSLFSKEGYESKIKAILDQTGFRGNYGMELTDIWMKITLKKHR